MSVSSRSNGTAEASARAAALLAHSVQNQASVLSYIDGFMFLGFATVGALLLMLNSERSPCTARDPGQCRCSRARLVEREDAAGNSL